MKKARMFVAGCLVGALTMTAAGAFADDIKSLVGIKVGSVWTLHVDGEAVGEVPIIKGSSYAPVRQIAGIAGMDVGFESGHVYLTNKANEPGNVEGGDEEVEMGPDAVEFKRMHIALYERMITDLESSIERREAEKKALTSPEAIADIDRAIESSQNAIANHRAEIAKLEAEIEALEAEAATP